LSRPSLIGSTDVDPRDIVSAIKEIKDAIERLSFEQRAEIAGWFDGWNDDEWDEQMKCDGRCREAR